MVISTIERMNFMTLKELQAYILELSPYQLDQIAVQVVKYLNLNEQLKNTRPECCQCCGKNQEHFIKKGFQHGKQRYMCKDCGKNSHMTSTKSLLIRINRQMHG